MKLSQAYNLQHQPTNIETNRKTKKTDADAEDTPKGTPTKEGLNTGKGDEYRQWTELKDGGEKFADAVAKTEDTNKAVINSEDDKFKKGCMFEHSTLFVLGFTNEQINKYFTKAINARTLSGKDVDGYYLRENIVINNKEIKTLQELIDALNITHDSNKHESTPLSKWLKANE